jgi:hypothetical protein
VTTPVRVAFCPILFSVNGGKFDGLGRPYIPTEEEYVRGKCDVGFDCGQCPYLAKWLLTWSNAGWQPGWECDRCLKRDVPAHKTADYRVRVVAGYYQSSRYRLDGENRIEVEPDNPLDGCTSCGWGSSFLQLVLRRSP